jgi:hypothetical protein
MTAAAKEGKRNWEPKRPGGKGFKQTHLLMMGSKIYERELVTQRNGKKNI